MAPAATAARPRATSLGAHLHLLGPHGADPARSKYGNNPQLPPTDAIACAYSNDGENTSTVCTYAPSTGKPIADASGNANNATVCPALAVKSKQPHCIGTLSA